MLKIGITGGIGSGKSAVCRVFATLGIPIFNADAAARYVTEHDGQVIAEIKKVFGEDAYKHNQLDRQLIASIVFNNPDKLKQLNGITHPATIAYAQNWVAAQQGVPYIIKEAALFFEAGSSADMDYIIGISAPKELRIERAMKRDNITRQQVAERIARQMDEEEKMKLCDYIITNNETLPIIPQVLELDAKFRAVSG